MPAAADAIGSRDFMSHCLYDGGRFRTLNVLDEGAREALAIEVDTSLRAKHVVRVHERLVELRGAPRAMRMDNGLELLGEEFVARCERHRIEPRFILPGKPD
jgi:putative transposase